MRTRRAANVRRGFSLLEMMVASAMMATLMASVVVVMRSGYASWNAQEADIDVLENGYGVLRHFVQQMRQAERITAISAASDTTGDLSILMPTGVTRTWSHNGAPLQVYFNNGTSNQLLAGNINTLTFTAYEADGVTPTTVVTDAQVVKCAVQVTLAGTTPHRFMPGLDSIVVTSNMQRRFFKTNLTCRPRRRGIALLVCLFVLSIVSVWVVNMFQSATVYQSALRNTIEYEQALYLANAGVHHAVAELELNLSWRGTVSAGSYPATGSYSATAVNGAVAGTVDITSTGVAGGSTRRLTATALIN